MMIMMIRKIDIIDYVTVTLMMRITETIEVGVHCLSYD